MAERSRLPETDGHFKVTVVPTPESLLVDVKLKWRILRSSWLHLIRLLVVDPVIEL